MERDAVDRLALFLPHTFGDSKIMLKKIFRDRFGCDVGVGDPREVQNFRKPSKTIQDARDLLLGQLLATEESGKRL